MGLDRRLGDHQPLGDLPVRQALRDEDQHLRLPLGQIAVRRLLRGRHQAGCLGQLRELRDQPLGDGGGQQRLAGRHHPYPVGELTCRGVLEEEAGGARPQRLVHVLVEVERGEHQHLRRAVRGDDLPGRLDAVHLGHADVHQDDVRGQFTHPLDRVAAVHRLADDLDVRHRAQQDREALAHHHLVVRDQHADRHASPSLAPGAGSLALGTGSLALGIGGRNTVTS
jgi:hypothetical protein